MLHHPCPLHVCNITSENPESDQCEADMALNFPNSYEVCKMSTNTGLSEYNPLTESEPNLDMMDTNIPNSELVEDAKQKRLSINVGKLSNTKIEFLSGPKLLPSLQETDEPVPSRQHVPIAT